MENWLSIIAGIYLLGMVLYGHRKGFIRLAVSMVALILTLTIVRVSLPVVTGYLKDHTHLQQTISENMKKTIGLSGEQDLPDNSSEIPSVQRTVIEKLNLPQNMKSALIENNNNEMYQLLGVQAFADYIGGYLANKILNSIGFVVLFAIVHLAIRLIVRWLDIIAKLPILSGINKITGALLGGIQGLVFIWLICILITAFSGTSWGLTLSRQIESSRWLSYLYNHNFLNLLVLGALQSFQ